jgi:prepilin-type N-terminal cleavage/methylation domain-containing protein
MKTSYVRTNSGFTLFEVLVTAIISSVMVLALISGATGFFSRDSQEQQRVLAQQRLRLVTSVISSDLREAGYIYRDADLNTIVGLVNGGTSSAKLNGTTPKLAVLVPYKGTSAGDKDKFRLVIYALGPIPNAEPFNSISSIKGKGNVIYRWFSAPEEFDPITQEQGNGKLPDSLDGSFITYGGAGTDTLPPVLVVGVANDGLSTTSAGGQFGPENSDLGKNITVQAYQDSSLVGDAPKVSFYAQARNLGLPSTPIPPSSL